MKHQPGAWQLSVPGVGVRGVTQVAYWVCSVGLVLLLLCSAWNCTVLQ